MTRRTLVLLPVLLVALSLAPRTEGDTKGPSKLPSFVRRCSVKDPQLNKCATESGREVIPKVVRGYPPMRLRSLDPLAIEEIRVETGSRRSSTLSMHGRNVVVTGLAGVFLKNIDIDLKKKIYTVSVEIPHIEIMSDYQVDGQVLILPIKGQGKANFTFVNSTMLYEQPYKLVKKGDLLFHELAPSRSHFTTSQAYFHLGNLFNGDKVLGDNVNKFLNENWREVVDDLSGTFLEAAEKVIAQFTSIIVENIPYKEIFLDTENII